MQPKRFVDEFGVFLDVDGTLIDLAPHPDAVVVPSGLVQDLELADERLAGALALISGRKIADLDRLFFPLRLKASGVHGAEFRFEPGQATTTVVSNPLPSAAWHDLLEILKDFPGSLAENKSFSFAVHYRAAPASGLVLKRALEDFVTAHPDLSLRIMPGHFVFELKRADFDKGVAVERFMEHSAFRGRRPIFVGDDVTDRRGFEVARAQGGLAFSVGAPVPDVSGTFPDPAAVRNWLREMVHPESMTA